ncbi:MAG: hypothetical protein WC718_10985 [Phycisphaerales bacterium]|jgi:hypothetical protein
MGLVRPDAQPRTRPRGTACKARANTMFRESRTVDQTIAAIQRAMG